MRISQRLLDGSTDEPLAFLAEEALRIAGADLVSVVLPTPDGTHVTVEVAAGEEAEKLVGYTYPLENSMAGLAFETGQPVSLGTVEGDDRFQVHQRAVLPIGPIMVVPLKGGERVRGALAVGRRIGRPPFDPADLDLATAFANQAAVALELADARRDQQRVAWLEDRDRIARDLHDHVIQRLFAAGLTLQGLATRLDEPAAQKLDRVVGEIDDTIAQVRTTIFGLRGQLGPRVGIARARVLEVVTECGRLLPSEPLVRFSGAIDSLVRDEVVDDLVAVVREALTNAARHSKADYVEVAVGATPDAMTLDITDNGIGIGATERGSGLDDLARRAESHGGTFGVGPAPAGPSARGEGTHLRWTIPLR